MFDAHVRIRDNLMAQINGKMLARSVVRHRRSNSAGYLVETNAVDVMEQLRKQLNCQCRIDATTSQQRHHRSQHGQHQSGSRIMIDVFGKELGQRLRQFGAKTVDQIAEGVLYRFG